MPGELAQSPPAKTARPSLSTEGAVLQERRSSPGLLLALVGHVAMRRLRDAHTASRLSPRQFHLLGLLHDHGPMSQSELGQATSTDPSILVTMLNPLETDRLITRERDPEDRRRHLVTLTSAGARHLNRAAKAQREAEDALLVALDDAQREQLCQLLTTLQRGLADEPSCPRSAPGDPDPQTAERSHSC
jgi:DNA-binding MarR family transcriptional regulator